MKDQAKRIAIFLPPQFKEQLEKLSDETGLAQSQLVVLATISMLVNYENVGSAIFADLLNPEHKQKG